ncbi:MAG: HAMP domain-containing protein [Clostridia bacterium]|nr:HAMP domain-containing protein [Clostridia bacterium]
MKSNLPKFRISKIRTKLFATIFAVLTALFVMITVFSTPMLFRVFAYRTYNDMTAVADSISACIPGSATYYFDLNTVAVKNNIDFELVNPDGSLAYTSASNGTASGSEHFASSAASTAEYSSLQPSDSYKNAVDYENFEIRKNQTANIEFFIYSYPLDSGETVHIYSEVADVENIVDVAGGVYSFISITMIIIMAAVFYILVAKFTKPLVEMNDVTKDMAALNFDRKCADYGKDEIGELGKSINTLSTTLDATLMDLKDKNGQLEKDIERRHALDNARKSFISNVSHELKTPIAIISGYAEGVCEGISSDPEVIKEYCQIINDESKKMNELVVELLELSKLESKTQPFMPEIFDIGSKIASLLNHLSLQFEQNGIRVINKVPAPLACFGEEDKIEIVLKNYITNAVSHCSGEKVIEIGCTESEHLIEISVFNTGEHIADSDMPELWDSFYRADKAHGRSENRFGLGLSIVKSIMDNHSCRCGVKNVAKGVVFTFEVSKDSAYYDKKR